jgi:Glycosyltransferase family 87
MEAAAVPLWSLRRVREPVALGALAGMVAVSGLIVAGAESRLGVLVPSAKLRYPGWLQGPLSGASIGIDSHGLAWLVVAMSACYLLVLACADALPARIAVGAVVALHAIFVIAPPLISSDVFGYIDAARLGALHGINPYSPASTHLPHDPVRLYRRWATDLPSPYGPLFVVASYALVPLGVAGALWTLKVITAVASLAIVWLVWKCAERLDRDPLRAALFVGLNPVVLVFGVGGAHNDFFAIALVMAGVYLAIAGRERLTGAAMVAAAAIKLPTGLPLVLAFGGLRGRRRRELLIGAAVALAGFAVLALGFFGHRAAGFVDTIRSQENQVAVYSVPNQIGKALGLGGATSGVKLVADIGFVAALGFLIRWVWRGADWVTAAGWAMFALLLATAWLLPWYAVWILPLAAISADRRLRLAALALAGYLIVTRVTLWLGQPIP